MATNPCAKGRLPKLFKAHKGGKAQSWQIWVDDSGEHPVIVTRYGIEGGQMQTTEDVVFCGKNVGKANETSALEQACAEAAAEWRKKKERKAYDETLSVAAHKRSMKPMLAQVYEKNVSKIDWSTALAQPKFDGFRCLVRRVDGELQAISRDGISLCAPHILASLENVVTDDMTLDGELYCHGLSLNKISSAAKRQQDLTYTLSFHLYDLVSEQPYVKRAEQLTEIFNRVPVQLAKDFGAVRLAPSVKVRTPNELTVWQADCIETGYEGAMLRHGKAGYEAGQRSASLLKVKTFVDGEFEIIDWKMGRGRYADIPVFTCETEAGNVFDVTAPGSLEEKMALGKKAADMVGRTIKVKHAGMTKTAKPVPFQPVALMILED